jgi:hypothetical protein
VPLPSTITTTSTLVDVGGDVAVGLGRSGQPER